jgi:5,10-methylene-tetrahydrofolate dehydrogenase/methenyl tetrahydrofolate cyclohydrolase
MDGRFSRAGSRLLRPLFQCLCWEDCGHGNTFSIHLRCYAVQGRSQGHGKTKIPLGRRAYSSDGVLQTRVLDGRSIAAAWQDELSGQVEKIKARGGRPPGLGVILVGDRLDSQIYVSRKQEACQRIGIKTVVRHLPTTSSQMGLRRSLLALCADHTIDGVLIQLPLPPHIDEEDIIEHIPPGKDVDGFHPLNVGRTLMRGCTARFVPCTALGCVELLRRSHIPIAGKNVAIIGDSNIVGMPLAMLFRDEGASTVTVVHRTSYSGLFRNDGGERSRLEVRSLF